MDSCVVSFETVEDPMKETLLALQNSFKEKYGTQPSFAVRIPGR